jgi:hypothetical protein
MLKIVLKVNQSINFFKFHNLHKIEVMFHNNKCFVTMECKGMLNKANSPLNNFMVVVGMFFFYVFELKITCL